MLTFRLRLLLVTVVAVLDGRVLASSKDVHNRRHDAADDPPQETNIIPNVYAVHVKPSLPCQTTVGAALRADGCQAIFRTDVQTSLASMCSYEIMNSCVHHHNNPSYHSRFLSEVDGFMQSFSVSQVERHETLDISSAAASPSTRSLASFDPQTEETHKYTGVLDARYKLGLTGKGIKIGVIDDGVYYVHPALGGGFGTGYKIAFGYDFVGDKYDGTSASIVQDNDPFENCRNLPGGTFAAGLLVGDGANVTTPGFVPEIPFTGVALGATLGVYRVLGCGSGTTTSADIVAAAIYRAAQDGADIIIPGFSAQPSAGGSDGVDAVAAQIVSNAGHIIMASIGDFGAAGAYVTGYGPGVSRRALTATSVLNTRRVAISLFIDGVPYQYTPGANNGNFTFDVPYPGEFVVNNPNAIANDLIDDGCAAINGNVTGKAVLLFFNSSSCSSAVRCNNAAAAGAAACILYFKSDILDVGIFGGKIPSLLTTLSAGQAIIADLAANKTPVVVVTVKFTEFPPSPTYGRSLYIFGSPGLTNDLLIKPDIAGIGNVFSTSTPFSARLVVLNGPYGLFSSTKVGQVYIAGCLALLLQKRGKIGLDAALTYLQNTATPIYIARTPIVLSPAYQGAGLVNVYKAATSGTLVTPSALSLNDTANRRRFETIRIQNNYPRARGPITYNLSHIPAATMITFNAGDDFVLDQSTTTVSVTNIASVRFQNTGSSTYSVTLQPRSSVSVRLYINAKRQASADLWPIYGGYIAITNSFDDTVTRVPYAGVAGAWKKRPMWSRNSTSLYSRWGLGDQSGPAAIFKVKPGSVGTGLYADGTLTPLTKLGVVNASNFGLILAPLASTTRYAAITITYLCNNDNALKSVGLDKSTNFVGILDVITLVSTGKKLPYFAWRGPFPRNTYATTGVFTSPRILGFDGTVFTSDALNATTKLPAGVYQMNFVARKNFGYSNDDADVVTTPPFQLIYKAPLSQETLAGCPVI